MGRPHDWPSRLLEVVRARRETPFAWGRHDCALFACDAGAAVCGIDFASGLRGRYRSQRGAMRALRRFAGGGLEQAAEKIASEHGCPEVPPRMARRGDIVLMDSDQGPVLGVCVGRAVAKAGAVRGLEYVPLALARRAWRTP